MQGYLKKHGKETAHHVIKIDWQRKGNEIGLHFLLQKRDLSLWHTDQVFTNDWSKNWGLWNKDVVEAFLQLRSSPEDHKAPYLEVQVSPLNQPFALIITEPRKTFYAPKKLDFKTSVELDTKTWRAIMNLSLPSDLKGDLLYGGFFACLAQNPREFYASEPNLDQAPDFHRPDLFISLDGE